MTVDDLITEFRDESDDAVTPYLWSDATLIRYMADAEMEAAQRAKFFIDSVGAISLVKVKANTGLATLDPRVIRVRSARVVGTDCALQPAYRRDLQCWPGWEAETGDACRFIRDYTSGKLRIHPMPTVDVVLQLTVQRGPLNTVASGGDELETPPRYQRKLVYWMLHRAYSKRDSGGDARDDKLAEVYAKKFTDAFGAPVDARNEVFEQQQEDVYDGLQFGND